MSTLDEARSIDSASPSPLGGETRRGVHFVGSLPPDLSASNRDAMNWILEHAGTGELATLPCDRDSRWIIDWLDGLRTRGPFTLVVDGDSSSYRSVPAYRVRRGHDVTSADVTPGRADEVASVFAARRKLRAVSLPPYQVSMPAPLDLALFAFGVPAAEMGRLSLGASLRAIASALRYLPVFTAAVAAEIEHIEHLAQQWQDEIVIQLESPAVMVAYDRAPHATWPMLTAILARHMATVVTAAPPKSRFVLHTWCHGDLGHQPIASLRDLTPAVALANALADRIEQARRAIPTLHIALCDAVTPPSPRAADYQPLQTLRPDIPLFAGLVDEHHAPASSQALQLTEQAIARPVSAVAAACGHGRRTAADTAANAALAASLTNQRQLNNRRRIPHYGTP